MSSNLLQYHNWQWARFVIAMLGVRVPLGAPIIQNEVQNETVARNGYS